MPCRHRRAHACTAGMGRPRAAHFCRSRVAGLLRLLLLEELDAPRRGLAGRADDLLGMVAPARHPLWADERRHDAAGGAASAAGAGVGGEASLGEYRAPPPP